MGLISRLYSIVPDPVGTLLQDYGPGGSDWGSMGWDNKEMQPSSINWRRTSDPAVRAPLQKRAVEILAGGTASIFRHVVVNWPSCQQTHRRGRVDPLEVNLRLSSITLGGMTDMAIRKFSSGAPAAGRHRRDRGRALCFVLDALLPGDAPMRIAAGRYGPDARIADAAEKVRLELGLDRPIAVQFIEWLGSLARFDLGHSLVPAVRWPMSSGPAWRLGLAGGGGACACRC